MELASFAAVGIFFVDRRVRDPYARWCGRQKPCGFLLSQVQGEHFACRGYFFSLSRWFSLFW